MTEARPSNYWIASNALYITLNANGGPDYLLGNTASGAHILCYMKGIDGLEYDAGHNYRRWPLSLTPTHFETHTEKYVYCAIPRPGNAAEMAVIVFPSEHLDIYGKNETGRQIGSEQYYYIWLQGIISSSGVTGANDRGWTQHVDTGTLASDEAMNAGGDETWWRYSSVDDTVTFLKEIVMDAKSVFHNLKARLLVLAGHELTGVATADTSDEFVDSDTLVATPGYVDSQYLSKTHESTAQEETGFVKGLWVKVKGLFGIDADGNIKGNDADLLGDLNVGGDTTIDGILHVQAKIVANQIESDNYTGEGFADTGYRLTSDDGTGSSALTVDNLHVRKKATFEELEVKKETAIAGNQVYSCAANVITRTDYYNGSGDVIGYSKISSPWLLKGLAIALGKRASNFKLFGRYKKVRVYLPDASQINYIRCYFLAKDGDREVENMWQAGKKDGVRWYNHGNDLARCQTMNLKNSNRRTYISSVGEYKLGNVYWWRKVINVSSEPVTIDGQEYHYFDVSMGDCDAGSDIPAAGDHVVQFGNDSDPDRMNIIVLEVNGGDAPAEKFYEGIHNYNLNDCYYGGHTMKARLSPKAGYKFQGSKFEIVTEYSVTPVPIERGEWVSGTTYYYYDLVQHNGATWLCVASAGNEYTVIEDIMNGSRVVYPKGAKLNQTQYDALTVAQKQSCTRTATGSTTLEPSEANSAVWRYYAKRGTSIKSVIVTYAKQIAAQYNGNPPTSGWKSTIDAVGTLNEGDYLWTKTVTSYSDTLNNTTTYTVSKWGIDGDGIDNIETKFYEDDELLSQAQLAALTESSWKEYSQLALTQGDYIYTRTKITYDKDSTPTINYLVNRIGQDGVGYVGIEEYYCLGNSMTTPPAKHPYQGTNHQPDIISPATMASRMNGGSWSEARPTYDTSTAQSRAKKYLWNFEAGYTTEANKVQITEPICIANYEKGILSIIETYAISAFAVASQSGGYPSDITSWTDEAHDCAPTDAKPYQWNKTETTYTDGTKDTFYHVSAVKGTKGNGIVSITRTFAISSVGTTSSETTEPSHQGSWTASSPAVTEKYPYLWAKEVVVFTDTTKNTTKYYCIGRRGDNGVDAQDVEWVYIRTKTNTAPTILNDNTYTDTNGKTYTSDDHLPQVSGNTNIENNQNKYQCTDDPKGVTEEWLYEWEIKRTKGEATNGRRSWNYYQGPMTLHNNFAQSAFIIDLDNDNDQFGTDSESKVLVTQTRSTTVAVYDGATQQTLNSLSVALTYEDGTSVASSVATSSADKTTGVVSVTVLQSNTAFSHEAINATITAEVTGKGTKKAVFTIRKVMSGQPGITPIIYQLAPTQPTFSFSRDASNNLTPTSRTSQINVAKTEGNTTTILSTAQSGITYKWGFDDSATATESNKAVGTSISVTNSDASSHYQVWVELSTGDRETLPIVKDGAKGDNGSYYVEDYGIGASRTSHSDVTSWSSSEPVPTAQKPYVWKRSRLYNPNTGAYGNATYVCLTGERGVNGKDGWMITANPANVIITQSLNNNTNSFSSATVSFAAKKGRESATITSIAIPTGQQALSNEFNATIGTGDDAKKVIVSSPKTHGNPAEYYSEGSFTVTINVTDPDTGSTVSFSVTVLCYANLLGTWKESVEAGTKTEVARSLTYGYDPKAGKVIPIENFGSFIKSSEENISTISRQINDPTTGLVTQISTIDQKADRISLSVESKENTNLVPDPDIYQTLGTSIERTIKLVKDRTYTLTARIKNMATSGSAATCNITITNVTTMSVSVNAGATKNTSKTFTATSTGSFTLSVPQTPNLLLEWLQVEQGSAFTKHDNVGAAFKRTGIDIENGLIKATTDNFVICNSSGTQTFSVDSDGNLVSSGSAKFSGTIEAKGGTIGGFVIGTSNIHSAAEDSSHNPLIQLNNDGSARIGGLVVANNGDATLTGTINATGGNISGNLTVGEVAAHRYHFEFKPKEAAGGKGSYSYYSAQLIGYSDNSATSKEEIFSIKMGESVEVDYQTLGWEPTIRLLTSYINPYRFYFERTIKNKTYSIRNELHEKNSSLKTSAWRDGSLVTMEIGVVNGKCNIVSYDNGSNIGWITDSLQTPVGGVYVTEMLGRMVMCVRT